MDNLVSCNKCGWVHFTVTTKYVKQWKKEWDETWLTMSEESKEFYGCKNGPPTIEENYLCCNKCGNSYKDFSLYFDYKKMHGHTIGGILDKNEDFI